MTSKKYFTYIFLAAILTFLGGAFFVLSHGPETKVMASQQKVKRDYNNEILVKFKNKNLGERKIQALGTQKVKEPSGKVDVISVPADKTKEQTIAELKADPNVEYAESNGIVKPTLAPNDTNYPSQWHLPKISAPQAWDIQTGSTSVKIAVLDTGVDITHADLAGRLISGYDFYDNDADPQDECGHGTAVAGIIGATTNNSYRVAGVDWNAKIMPLRALGPPQLFDNGTPGDPSDDFWTCAGDFADVAEGINYATANGVNVINMSFGGSGDPGITLQTAINNAYNAGVVLVASAGNSGAPGVLYPAAYSNVIAVGATDSSDVKASFSTTGPELDVVAPGVGLPTLDITGGPGSSVGGSTGYKSGDYYDSPYFSGTSAAAPVVSGVASLLKAQKPSFTPAQIKDALENNADKVAGMGGQNFTEEYGYGRVNCYMTVTYNFAITSPSNSGFVADKTPNITGYSDPGTTVSVSIDGGGASNVVANGSGDWSYQTPELSYGAHTVTATTTDLLGNPRNDTNNFTVLQPTVVYRFWSNSKQHHFYTSSQAEHDLVIATWPTIWSYEGVAYNSYDASAADIMPVYRFWSDSKQGHFYTISVVERDYVIATWPGIWSYEGVAFYAYSASSPESSPVYRFWSNSKQGHFYTASQAERDFVIATWPTIWSYEGAVYYVPN